MKDNREEFISSFITISILGDNRLTFLERLLLIHIISLSKKNGYCWATNKYFSNIYDVTTVTISKSISKLATFNYIKINFDNKNTNNTKRIIKLSDDLKNKLNSIKENLNTSYKEKFKQYNNKLNNNKDKIYYIDENGTEYWNGKPICKEKAALEEIEELNKLLNDICEEE
ncbi:MAG: helix-turn-helix domain-containing protein [Bacilli bacterium]